MTIEKLKPCPFCGGDAVAVYCGNNGARYTSNLWMPSHKGTIRCKKCGVALPKTYKRISDAAKKWNKRFL